MTYTPSSPDQSVVSKVQRFQNLKSSELPVPDAIDGSHYLCNGELVLWKGKISEVESCICVNDSGEVKRVVLGKIHQVDKPTALRLVDVAYDAFDLGRGKWPCCTVAERLDATQKFLVEMQKVREQVVVSLMWEIGKTRKDSENEFDRTVIYIQETINAVRTRNNADACFLTAEGHVAQVRRSPLGVVLSMGPFN